MASHNPKLNVYVVKLNNRTDTVETFKDFALHKFDKNGKLNDSSLFKKYFEEFIKELGSEEFKNDKKSQKVIGVSKQKKGTNYSISYHSDKSIIEGVIEGGKYGLRRDAADINDKDGERTAIDENKAILDKFYFMLYTPFNHGLGILLIQSYTEETIQSSFKNIIKDFFALEELFYKADVEPFMPEKFVESYRKSAKVSMFSYITKQVVKATYRGAGGKELIDGNEFEVTIQLKPKGKIEAKESMINSYLESISKFLFQNKSLENMDKKVFMKDSNNRKTSYDVEKEINSIRPTIYLTDEGIGIDDKTKLPNFEELKEYCFKLLEEVKKELTNEIEGIEEF